jgi:hypothetical protein
MEIPETNVSGQNVVITWQVPYENSDYVSEYRAYVLAKDGQFLIVQECSVSGNPPPNSCSISMLRL